MLNSLLVTYKWTALAIALAWGASGFMATPGIASGFYHLTVVPFFLLLIAVAGHFEGRKKS